MATQAKQKQGHTPGPWKLDAKPGLPVYVYAQQPVAGSIPPLRLELASVCSLEDGRHNEQKRAETLANARLIAASPDLLATVRTLLGDIDSLLRYSTDHEGDTCKSACEYCRHVKQALAALAKTGD